MPTYEYECETCGIRFERRQKIMDAPLEKCPECEGPVRRVLFPVGIVFKGSGFYCTDHRSGSSSGMIPPNDKPEEGKAEAKPAEKEEPKAEKDADPKAEKNADPKAEKKAADKPSE